MKAYVVGSLNMDMVLNISRMPIKGETMFADSYFQNCGGKGANQAIACAKLGSDVSMIGKVGMDSHGQTMIENLYKNNVDVSAVTVSKKTISGIAFIMVQDGDNRIILEKGANEQIKEKDIDLGLADAVEGDMLVLQLEVPLHIVLYALRIAKKKNMTTLLNPAPAIQLSSKLLDMVDIIVLNESEAAMITGVSDKEKWMETLQSLGISNIILTIGAEGSILCESGSHEHIPAREVEVVDTTAAGDTFIGGIVYSLLQGYDLLKACRLATVAASITVTRRGASQSIPTLAEVLEVMKIL